MPESQERHNQVPYKIDPEETVPYTEEEIRPLSPEEFTALFRQIQERTLTPAEALKALPRMMTTVNHLVYGTEVVQSDARELADIGGRLLERASEIVKELSDIIRPLSISLEGLRRVRDETEEFIKKIEEGVEEPEEQKGIIVTEKG